MENKEKLSIDKLVDNLLDKMDSGTRNWSNAKRDRLKHKGSKIKMRQFVRIVSKSLPQLTKTSTNEGIDHRANIIKVYCRGGLAGISKYEKAIWGIYKIAVFQTEMLALDSRASNILLKAFKVDDITHIQLEQFIVGMENDLISNTKGAGKLVMEELGILHKMFS